MAGAICRPKRVTRSGEFIEESGINGVGPTKAGLVCPVAEENLTTEIRTGVERGVFLHDGAVLFIFVRHHCQKPLRNPIRVRLVSITTEHYVRPRKI